MTIRPHFGFLLGVVAACSIAGPALGDTATIPYRGVNLSGAESGGCTKPARYGFTYLYPTSDEIDHFINLGMNTFRIPFCWERLQSQPLATLDPSELKRLDTLVNYATGRGVFVVLDPHNYGRYWGKPITTDTDRAAFSDFWKQLAMHYRDNQHVFFGLMNEPHGIDASVWIKAVNDAIAAIRNTGAKNLVLVPGVAWTGAHSWSSASYGTPNSVAMLRIDDPADNYVYEVHQYLDQDSSGTKSTCVSENIGAQRITDFNNWLRRNGARGFLAEFGAARNETCYAALADLLTAIRDNPTLWLGWTYWSAGPWLGNYMYALPLRDDVSPSQVDVLERFLFN